MADGETWTGLSKAGERATNHGFEDGHQSPGLLETCCESCCGDEGCAVARNVCTVYRDIHTYIPTVAAHA